MILSAMILSQGWIRKLLPVPPSRAEVRASLQTGRSWQQHRGSRRLRFKALRWSSFGGPQKGDIAPNAPAASTTRLSQGLISSGFSASIGAWIQKSFRHFNSSILPPPRSRK